MKRLAKQMKQAPMPGSKKVAAIRTAAKRNDWKSVHQLVKPYPTIRRALGLLESYTLIECWEGNSRQTSGWARMDFDIKQVWDAVHFVKQGGVLGKYRIISIKRVVTMEKVGGRLNMTDCLPKSPKPVYELEQWLGEPKPGQPLTGWVRIDFPSDYRERKGKLLREWVIAGGHVPDTKDAFDHLQRLGAEGKFRIITIKRVVHIEMLNGKVRKWTGHCICPDDGRYPEREPKMFLGVPEAD